MSISKIHLKDKADELDDLLEKAIDQDDWTPEFKPVLWKCRRKIIDILEMLD